MTTTKTYPSETKITSISHLRVQRPGSSLKAKVFVQDSKASDLADEFFNDKKIHSLHFKCKAWAKVKNFATKIEGQEIRRALREFAPSAKIKSVSFSEKAGCSCGCSPGFNIVLEEISPEISGKRFWVVPALRPFLEMDLRNVIDVAKGKLESEIAANK